ncbi:unnamed protein product [Lepeophtheirus salmonis]|uniref:(salmon louse) hypothetical protein n=1 Tax=Lepeophtheirus salmonis TaxID=72036 RepID=A0A7R8H1Y8_LEPSM|nr:unnamed protein product [Lepeophtheirus salmonis]CAF2819755.1 unnamed protein product [Lepeophtheirus salmonis]
MTIIDQQFLERMSITPIMDRRSGKRNQELEILSQDYLTQLESNCWMKRETIEIGKGDGEKIPKPEEIEKSTAKFNGKIQKCHANEEDEAVVDLNQKLEFNAYVCSNELLLKEGVYYFQRQLKLGLRI